MHNAADPSLMTAMFMHSTYHSFPLASNPHSPPLKVSAVHGTHPGSSFRFNLPRYQRPEGSAAPRKLAHSSIRCGLAPCGRSFLLVRMPQVVRWYWQYFLDG